MICRRVVRGDVCRPDVTVGGLSGDPLGELFSDVEWRVIRLVRLESSSKSNAGFLELHVRDDTGALGGALGGRGWCTSMGGLGSF